MAIWSDLKNLLTDLTGRTVPNQYYNPNTDAMEIVQGSGGASNVQLAGSNITNVYKKWVQDNAYSVLGITPGAWSYGTSSPSLVTGYGHKGIWVYNNANQTVTIQPVVETTTDGTNIPGLYAALDATKTVAAGASAWLTSTDFPHLDSPYEYLSIAFQYSVAPTLNGAGTGGTTPLLTIVIVGTN